MPNVKRLREAATERWPENHTATEQALRTWYPKDRPLHYDLHHPLGKLVGELGELLDDYMKSIYKPGYVFEPEDELGDNWYYLRILAYQNNHELKDSVDYLGVSIDQIIAQCIFVSSGWFCGLSLEPISYILNSIYSAIVQIAEQYNLTIDQLTASNWEKLKPGSERGEEWMKAREFNTQKQLNETLNKYLETKND